MSDDPKYITCGSRKARISINIAAQWDDNKGWAVFMHTLYLNRWYYDGYSAHATYAEAEHAMNVWLGLETEKSHV